MWSVGIRAQENDPQLETRLLRAAAGEESLGDLSEAEETLRDLMDQRPTSAGGLLALERVLRARDRHAEILPLTEVFVALEPDASSPRLVQLRVYAELGDLSALEDAAEDWLKTVEPSVETYRRVASVYDLAIGPERALAVLEQGRIALGRPSLFAMETGDLLKDLGRIEEAILEWAMAIGSDGTQVSGVLRRVGEIEEDRETFVLPLLEQLGSPPRTPARLRAGARIALEAGAFEEARGLAEAAVEDLGDRPRRGFLTALARQAQDVSAPGVELWAYEALKEGAVDDAEARALDQRITVAALATGDTARAVAAQQAIADDLPEGHVDRQRVLAEIIRLQIQVGDGEIRELLTAFAEEFPAAPQLDELAVTLAVQLDAAGDQEGARSLLAGVGGPRSALERGYLYLAAGEVAEGRQALQDALTGVSASVATEVIALLDLLDGLEGEPLSAFIRSVVLAHRGRAEAALAELDSAIMGVPRDGRPALLAMGARMAEEGRMPDRAAASRAQLIRDHPYSSQMPEATLELARYLGSMPDGAAEAILLLENLILSQPNSAIVPTARRELQRIQSGAE
jgi:tetratricopeptide (TPR) repeat protein